MAEFDLYRLAADYWEHRTGQRPPQYQQDKLRAMLDSGPALRHVMDAVDAAVSRIGMLGTAEQYGRVVTEQCRETWRRLVRDGVIKGKGDNGHKAVPGGGRPDRA